MIINYQIKTSRFGGVVNTLPCYVSVCSSTGNPFGGVGSNPAGDAKFFLKNILLNHQKHSLFPFRFHPRNSE